MENSIFRPKYRELSEAEKLKVDMVKVKAERLLEVIQDNTIRPFGPEEARAVAIAKTKLEEVVMWAVKGITG